MFVKIFKLEDEERTLTTFCPGTHIIGRGSELQCNDKRVSRNHATLEITGETVTLTSNHINPCFLRIANSKTITILAKDSGSVLSDGDAFAFLPHDFWFKIKICEDLPNQLTSKEDENTIKGDLKRYLSDPEQGTSEEKKIKVENADSVTAVKEKVNDLEKIAENGAELNHETHIDEPNIQQEENCTINLTNNMGNESNNEQIAQDTVVDEDKEQMTKKNICTQSPDKTENLSSSDQSASGNSDNEREEKSSDETAAGTSKVKSKRERCWYGAQCYRKNPQHRNDFSHPGDSDFESDPEDDRPSCSFGAACYRKNQEHRRKYKHPPGKPPSQKTKRSRKKVDRLNVAEYDDSDLSDVSDDPFGADGDSDEYVQDTDGNSEASSEDTDSEDSQNIDEDSENVRRMVKEAKRFMKK